MLNFRILSDIKLDKSNAVILAVVAGIIILIVIISIAKGKSLASIILLIIAGIIAYLLISADVLRL